MAPEWARATRPLVVIFTGIGIVVTIVFSADVDAQARRVCDRRAGADDLGRGGGRDHRVARSSAGALFFVDRGRLRLHDASPT